VSKVVLDASALLALLNTEPGHEGIAGIIGDAAISAVNLSKVAAKLADRGMPGEAIQEALDGLALDIHDFDQELAFQAGFLHPLTRSRGLSLDERACLALGQRLNRRCSRPTGSGENWI
jgi:PIN domain nuclease of toxin-antitoxin system